MIGEDEVPSAIEIELEAADSGFALPLAPPVPTAATGAPSAAPGDPLLGALIEGRYRVERVLGQGGMGRVYQARQERLGKPVALKVLLQHRNGELRKRMLREARIACRVRHPHVVAVEDCGELDASLGGQPYLVMELVEGPTLEELLQGGPLPAARAVRIALQIIDALEAIHRAQVIHRDLKPQNVLLLQALQPQDFVKIVDFGLAGVLPGLTAEERLTRPGAILGTPHYMAPEQLEGEEVDERSDQYALGCVLHEMLTGARPTSRGGAPMPAALEPVVRRMLARAREQRWDSLAALREALL